MALRNGELNCINLLLIELYRGVRGTWRQWRRRTDAQANPAKKPECPEATCDSVERGSVMSVPGVMLRMRADRRGRPSRWCPMPVSDPDARCPMPGMPAAAPGRRRSGGASADRARPVRMAGDAGPSAYPGGGAGDAGPQASQAPGPARCPPPGASPPRTGRCARPGMAQRRTPGSRVPDAQIGQAAVE